MATQTTTRPAPPEWTRRLCAAIGYLGLAPIVALLMRRNDDLFSSHHVRQALAAQWLLLMAVLSPAVILPLQTYVFLHHDDWNPAIFRIIGGLGLLLVAGALFSLMRPHAAIGDATAFACLVAGGVLLSVGLPGEMTGTLLWLAAWIIVSLVGMATALAGSMWAMPLVDRLGGSTCFRRVAFIGNSLLLGVMILFLSVIVHANSLARDEAAPAPVYFLFDQREYPALGTWGPKFLCYRVSRVAQRRWGDGNVVVAPAIAENIRTAIQHGRFVVLITHGAEGKVCATDPGGVWVPPDFSENWAVPGKELQFIYISACDGGMRASEWQQRFAPAEVVTFGRTSGGIEHLWWLWFEAPRRLAEVR